MRAGGVMGAARPPLRAPRGYLRKGERHFIFAQIFPPEAFAFCQARTL